MTRVAVISVIVENPDSVGDVNRCLFECRDYILGRLGIPYRARKVDLIAIAIDAPENVINTLSGRLGRLPGVSAKINYTKVQEA